MSSSNELVARELVGRCRRSWCDVRRTEVQGEELVVIEAREQVRSEPSGKQRRPEAISWSPEVVSNRGGVQPWIDPAEHDVEP